ncbi:MAG: phosphate acyltransferase PlsX [Gammaproteobacteria bacterium]|nr:phosphate acyltransferase PlsX [Gammaproteobacteria bacterium]MDH3372217.1 phosphate acyltransferase PlsX [Gammaproteobacteria bacterium]MDH3408455.1 phosphate acyltransferase PlsX [Gammaproteobacteria bacterium]MDH3551215.1 phosphate acyltransferase PlsX [Gammaproteobacteria bacterium]
MPTHSIISLDAMSGDLGAEVVVRAAHRALHKHAKLKLLIVGDEEELRGHIMRIIGDEPRLSIVHASEVVAMSESPADALRKKKDSSMRVAINLVKEGKADACVSAGNTGALMATAKFVLKMLPGIDRPAIITELPAKGGSLHMLDLGANTLCTAEHLFQFAVMGSIVTEDITGIENPRIALLNIGAEDSKGHGTIKDAAAMLNGSTLNYIGFIEGSELFSGKADVVVTDGFTGNVALKTMEGTVDLIVHSLRRAFTRNLFAKIQAMLARPVLSHLAGRMDPRKYNGATLVGLNGIVIKSHGSADSFAFEHAIETAVVEVQNQVPQQIGNLLQQEAA